MSITREQWAEIEEELSGSYGLVGLLCDGYKVTAEIQHVAPLKQGIFVYVNGVIKVEWMQGKAEEAQKFHRETKHYLFSAKHREEAAKFAKNRHLSADARKRFAKMASERLSTWRPYWTNAKAFTRHLRKTCTDIRLEKVGAREV